MSAGSSLGKETLLTYRASEFIDRGCIGRVSWLNSLNSIITTNLTLGVHVCAWLAHPIHPVIEVTYIADALTIDLHPVEILN
jgi:hypothetical protein